MQNSNTLTDKLSFLLSNSVYSKMIYFAALDEVERSLMSFGPRDIDFTQKCHLHLDKMMSLVRLP